MYLANQRESLGHQPPRSFVTTAWLASSISSIFSGCLPPASAKSGRPPPPPPTIGAISFTIWPALISRRQVRRDRDDDLHLAVARRTR